LHPNQQENMAYQLRTLSKLSDHQVFITSHSPNFLDKAHENLLEIIRVKRDFGITCIHQPTQGFWSVFWEGNSIYKSLTAYGR
jgi:predicted ATP-dependent endonuclease of OLD family